VTAVKVVDASALAAVLFGEPEAEAIAARLETGRLVAPALLGFELGNVCLVKCRRRPELRDALLAAFELRSKLAVEELAVDYTGALQLALETRLTLYDASYLWLAQQLAADLITLDKELGRAAATR
jgi:predicted nucleic acid-binding protein